MAPRSNLTSENLPDIQVGHKDAGNLMKRDVGTEMLPQRLNGPLAWTGEKLDCDELYTYTLSQHETREVAIALAYFKGLGLDGNEVNRTNFPLPTLGKRLQRLSCDIFEGLGFFSVRGLDPKIYTSEDNVVIFLGISSYISDRRGVQDDSGYMLSHIREAKYMIECQQNRPIRDSNIASKFHTDMFCDILAMHTRSLAAIGGRHLLASAWTVYNEIAETRPDVIQLLSSPTWAFDTPGRLSQLKQRPLLYYHEGRIIMNFVREALVSLPEVKRAGGKRLLSDDQLEALDVLEVAARKHQLVLNMLPGDITFVNNFALLHSREAFEDDKDHTRYLVRMWLKNSNLAWELPAELEEGNKKIFNHDDLIERWNVLPKTRILFSIPERLTP